ncbi:sigma-70 family RNA polymerase sigma factor [Sphingomonas prati]|uniref:RNA polymerase sigma-70 factor (ECF subfamily) n=1 Tax=Sphingomonas prati TaxID=1843237 RepID=A0A7W9BU80_9SPHN|nr:sigma-70 family RNA polymerase sigma factor [Sphingomonas prati]MBB5730106.1 RNA polymerase sigma-70 factor (ECF subfamily) [Sphingomonas prati]GGE91532.1 RNA polymerase sigma factor [Sphingomonas prati]
MDDLEQLLHRVGQQDRAAFALLYERTSAKLNGIVRRILPEMTLADDVLQDVYVRIWRSAAGYEASRGRPVTWMAAIARNLAIDVRRREASRGLGRQVVYEPDLGGAAPGIDAELALALRRCLEVLEPVQREMIVAAYCEGMSREELADRHTRPVGTVKSWLHRGLAALKACLSDD